MNEEALQPTFPMTGIADELSGLSCPGLYLRYYLLCNKPVRKNIRMIIYMVWRVTTPMPVERAVKKLLQKGTFFKRASWAFMTNGVIEKRLLGISTGTPLLPKTTIIIFAPLLFARDWISPYAALMIFCVSRGGRPRFLVYLFR